MLKEFSNSDINRRIFIYSCISLISIICSLQTLIYIGSLSESATNGDIEQVGKILIIITAIMIIKIICDISSKWLTLSCHTYSRRFYQIKTSEKIVNADMIWLDNHQSGDLIERMQNGIDNACNFMCRDIPAVVTSFLTIFCTAAAMIYLDWRLGIIYFSTVPVILYFQYKASCKIELKIAERQKCEAKRISLVQDVLSNINTVKTYNLVKYIDDKMSSLSNNWFKYALKSGKIQVILMPLGVMLSMIPISLTAVCSVYFVVNKTVSISHVISFLLLMWPTADVLMEAEGQIVELRMSMSVAKRILDIWNAPQANNKLISNVFDGSAPLAVQIEDMYFSYEKDREILKGVSLSVGKQEHVAIVGKSGCGKSTLLKVMAGLYKATGGSLSIFGEESTENALQHNKFLSYVPQNIYLFPESLEDNVNYGTCADKDSDDIIKLQHSLDIEFIENLPKGWETIIGDEGMHLSGGQQQCIGIMQALMHKPELLLLDESTSALDANSEAKIINAINKEMQGKAMIVTAHRFSAIRDVDRIIVMDDGKVAEEGTHEQLIKADGLYAMLYNIQEKEGLIYEG